MRREPSTGPWPWRHLLASVAAGVFLLAACARESPDSLIESARQHVARNDLRTAQIELRNAIQKAPESGPAYRLLGTVLVRLGDPASAESALRKALDLGQRPDDVLPLLAQVLVRRGAGERLIKEFGERSLAEPAANAAFLSQVGQAWLAKADTARATQAFEAALAAVPGHAAARLGQAQIAARGGRIDDALAVVAELLAADARLADGHALKGHLLIAKGARPAAAEAFETALGLEPEHVTVRAALASLRISAREIDKARQLLDAAPGPSAGDPRLAYLRIAATMHAGELAKARELAAKLLERVPDHAPTLTLLGEIEARAGFLPLAEAAFQRALQSDPSATAARRQLVVTHIRQGRPAKAVDALQPLLKDAEANDPSVLLLAGEVYLASGDVERAAAFFEEAKAGGAESAARLKLGQIAIARGELDKGLGELQSAAEQAPGAEADLRLVALHLQRREFDRALAAAEAFAARQAQNPLGPTLIGTVQVARKKPGEARARFEAALKMQADFLPAVQALSTLDRTEGRGADSVRRLETLSAAKPADEQLLIALAEVQERADQPAKAADTLRRAVKANHRSVTAHAALVRHLLRRGDPQAAMAAAREAAAADPAQPRLLELLGSTQEATGDRDGALASFQELVRREPHSLGARIELATLQARRRELAEATRTLRQAQQAAPFHDGVHRELVAVGIAAGRYDDALAAARALQARKPRAALGFVLEGDTYAAQRQWGEAERAYRAALKLEPASTAAAIRLGRSQWAAGRRQEANQFAAQWIARHPADVAMRIHQADLALDARDWRAAVEAYDGLLPYAPDNALALNNLASALGELNDPRALEVAERALKAAPDSASVLDTVGMLHLQRGDAQKGLAYLERVRKLAPHRKDLRLHYAIGLQQAGRKAESKAELLELAASNEDFPGTADIPRLLGKL
jgi:putative PEP-CTERM system TPR-repeat lipoprotein